MNYYTHHIGDYAEATSHLSLLEDGIYSRLLRKYYANEEPLPANVNLIARQIGVRSDDERAALEAVLQDFFTLQQDGWHQGRCDAEIELFHAKLAGLAEAKDNAKIRQRRAREHRKTLFEQLRALGVVPAFSTTTPELAEILSRTQALDRRKESQSQAADVHSAPCDDVRVTCDNGPVTRDDTAPPISNPQYPIPKNQKGVAGEPIVNHLTAGFVEFWSVWPKSRRKEARGRCAEVWYRNRLELVAGEIVAHVKAKAQTAWAEKDGEFMESPLVYLNQRRWEGADLRPQGKSSSSHGTGRHTGLYKVNHNKGIKEDGSLA